MEVLCGRPLVKFPLADHGRTRSDATGHGTTMKLIIHVASVAQLSLVRVLQAMSVGEP